MNRSLLSAAICLFILVIVLSVGSGTAGAATYTVSNLDDSGSGSLRKAITDSNANPGADTINFAVSGTIFLASTLPNLSDAAGLTIDGAGQTVYISGNNTVRVGRVDAGASLTLSNLTIAGGHVAAAHGGGIYNSGTLTVTNSTFSGNSVTDTGSYGGAIYNSGTLTVTNSTFSGNSAIMGGAIFVATGSTALLTNVTVSANSASITGSGIAVYFSGTATLRNTIVANNTGGGNCGGVIINGGNNIDSGASCGWGSANGSMSNTDPVLSNLANFCGPNWTFGLYASSPALDGVTYNAPNGAPETDQRGAPRPQGGGYDIGAYEMYSAFRIGIGGIYPDNGGSVLCTPECVLANFNSVCTITPANSGADHYYVSQIKVTPDEPFWYTDAEPTTKYLFADVTQNQHMLVFFSPTSIWLYWKNPLTSVWMPLATDNTITAAFQDVAINHPDTHQVRLPAGGFAESGGVVCIWNLNTTLSGGWSTETVRSANPMSKIAGPFTITGSCALTVDGITVE